MMDTGSARDPLSVSTGGATFARTIAALVLVPLLCFSLNAEAQPLPTAPPGKNGQTRFCITRSQLDRANETAELSRVLAADLAACKAACSPKEERSVWPVAVGGGVVVAALAFVLGVVVAK